MEIAAFELFAFVFLLCAGAHVTHEDIHGVNAITCARSHAVRNKLIEIFNKEVETMESGVADAYATLAVQRFLRMGVERDRLKAEAAKNAEMGTETTKSDGSWLWLAAAVCCCCCCP